MVRKTLQAGGCGFVARTGFRRLLYNRSAKQIPQAAIIDQAAQERARMPQPRP